MKNIYKELLHKSQFCKDLSKSEFDEVVSATSFISFSAGEFLFHERESARGFFVLLLGKVRIYKCAPNGKEQTIHYIAPGHMFAEAALFEDATFPASARAIEDSTVAFFTRDRFFKLLKLNPKISLKIIASLSKFVREYNRIVASLSLKYAPARLAESLMILSEGGKLAVFELPMNKGDFANKLAITRETLSRTLRKMQDLKIIEIRKSKVKVLDFEALQNIAEGLQHI